MLTESNPMPDNSMTLTMALDKTEEHFGMVASLKLPISLRAMKSMGKFIEQAYGKNCVMREQPKGWLMIEKINPDKIVKEPLPCPTTHPC